MYTVQVTADKLNIRNTPVADPTYANWVGDMNKGEVFNAIEKVQGSNADFWFVDSLNRYISADWVSETDQSLLNVYPWWINKYGFNTIWNKSMGENIVIGILDTGIDDTHPDLINAINLLTDCAFNDGDSTKDLKGHGTHCAGIICAQFVTSQVIGVSRKIKLNVYKVYNDDIGDRDSFLINGITAALRDKVNIISISRGCKQVEDIVPSIKAAVEAGIHVVVAGGNSNESLIVNPLSQIEGVIAVGAINENENGKFQGGNEINSEPAKDDCFAPGINILSTVPVNSGGYGTKSGSSMAAAFIAGLIALKLSCSKDFIYDVAGIKQQIINASIQANGYKIINPQNLIL